MKKYISIEKYLKQEKNKPKRNHKIGDYFLLGCCLLTFTFSLFKIIKWNIDNFKIHKLNKEIASNIEIGSDTLDGELVNPPLDKNSNYYYYASFPLYDVDFSKLISQNKDTVGFINIKNTIINYPVVRGSDNSYYLNHSFDNKKNSAGAIYMDYRNSINELSDNTIIYGHSRKDGTMFASLRNTLLSSWQENKDNYVIYFKTLKENMLFQIFSIYTIKEETYYLKTSFSTKEEKQKWIERMQNRNIASLNAEVNINDKFLTLSTCQNNQGVRIVIHAKLIKMRKIE